MEIDYTVHNRVNCIYCERKQYETIVEHIILMIRNCVMLSFEDG